MAWGGRIARISIFVGCWLVIAGKRLAALIAAGVRLLTHWSNRFDELIISADKILGVQIRLFSKQAYNLLRWLIGKLSDLSVVATRFLLKVIKRSGVMLAVTGQLLAQWTVRAGRLIASLSRWFDRRLVVGDKKLAVLSKWLAGHGLRFGRAAIRHLARFAVAVWRFLKKLVKLFGGWAVIALNWLGNAGITAWRYQVKTIKCIAALLVSIITGTLRATVSVSVKFDRLLVAADRKLGIPLGRLYQYAILIRLNKPIGILLLGWPTLWALWLSSNGEPDSIILLIFVLGVILMRSAGCAINDYADRDIDAHVDRTKDRPIASGRIHAYEALLVFFVLVSCALYLVLLLNELSLWLSIGAVISAASYPFMKRFTFIPQAFLGIAFGWAVPMAWAAQTNTIPEVSWLLFIIVVLWAMAYDTMYAMVDRDDDIEIGVKSTAILFGDADKIIIAGIQLSVLGGLGMLGERLSMDWPYYAGLGVASCFSLYQQYLIRHREPNACLRAFLNNNWFGAAVFIGIVANYYFIN